MSASTASISLVGSVAPAKRRAAALEQRSSTVALQSIQFSSACSMTRDVGAVARACTGNDAWANRIGVRI